jgi:preprotein translocase subunit SecD
MKLKIFLCSILCMTLLVSLVSACSTKDDTSGPTLTPQSSTRTFDIKVNGGIELIYQADLSTINDKDRTISVDRDISVIQNRLKALGESTYIISKDELNRITVEVPLSSDISKVSKLLNLTAILEFGELTKDTVDPSIKWRNNMGAWKPAVGTIDGNNFELSSSFFKDNVDVKLDKVGKAYLIFEWTSDGRTLYQQISQRLLGKALGHFSGDQALTYEDGSIMAPIIRVVGLIGGEIKGPSNAEITQLIDLIKAGQIAAPLTLLSQRTVSAAK